MKNRLLAAIILITTELCAYEVLLFSDTHYDALAVRDTTQKLLPHREKEMQRNFKVWQETMPRLLATAGNHVRQHTPSFALHLGDLIQGDCGNRELHESSFKNILRLFNQNLSCPLYFVKGNHDIRGAGAQEAWDAVMRPHLNEILQGDTAPAKPACHALRYQDDLYIFFDAIKPDVKFLTQTLEKHRQIRHLFFLTHYPLLPCTPTSFGGLSLYATAGPDKLKRITALLAQRNATVLCGHIHRTTYTTYRSDLGAIRQFSSFSIVSQPQLEPAVELEVRTDMLTEMPSKMSETHKNYWDCEYQGKIKGVTLYNAGATGFNSLFVEDDGVWIKLHGAGQSAAEVKITIALSH